MPDTRAPLTISFIFTGAVLAPIAILFILVCRKPYYEHPNLTSPQWIQHGANISGFSFSLSAIVFHVSFGGMCLQ